MAAVHAGHQGAAAGGLVGAAGVGGGEPCALGGEAIDMRGQDVGLAVATEVTRGEVIGDDQDDVGPTGAWGGDLCGEGQAQGGDQAGDEQAEGHRVPW